MYGVETMKAPIGLVQEIASAVCQEENPMRYTIFSIDGEDELRNRQFFETMFRTSRYTVGALMPMTGCYKGETEHSYICLTTSFEAFVYPMGFVANQESILRVSECNKKYTVLKYIDGSGRPDVYLGCMTSVPEKVAKSKEAWTYRPDVNGGTYWITQNGNNDHHFVKVWDVEGEDLDPERPYMNENAVRAYVMKSLIDHRQRTVSSLVPQNRHFAYTLGTSTTDQLIEQFNCTFKNKQVVSSNVSSHWL